MRYAIYFTPDAGHPLVRAAEDWLGRSVFGRAVEPADIGGFSPQARAVLIASAVRYGFHGTLKAPFRLAADRSESELVAAFDAFCGTTRPIAPVSLKLSDLDGFFALTPAGPVDELNGLASGIVRHFEPFRAPLTEAEIARRRPEKLSPQQRELLETWGYPYIFDAFRFHMTLSDRLDGETAAAVHRALDEQFDALVAAPVAFDRLAIFAEPAPGAPFICLHQAPLAGTGG
ncbi:DUF1045 domain-containing protein [Stappia indica]|uniref:DUF1045 domain-containing protein n=1 Tax=Stappia indica TaxID=538381 RepID=UPI0008321337|nr:DUF1045 domain-containing protein [Stappia indica]